MANAHLCKLRDTPAARVVVVLALTRINNQVPGHRTGSSHSGVEKYPRERTQTKPQGIHAYVIDDAIHASARKI